MSSAFAASGSASASATILQPANAAGQQTARLYGPAATRQDRIPWAEEFAEEYDGPPPARATGPGRHGGYPRTAFYNTREGEAVIAQARLDLSARAKPVDRLSDSHRSTVQDNRQRAYHAECVLPADLADQPPAVSPAFQQYPLQEYAALTGSGAPLVQTQRLKSVPYTRPNGPKSLDVARRHDLVANIKKARSISNHDHGLPFLAKHTNNLVSC